MKAITRMSALIIAVIMIFSLLPGCSGTTGSDTSGSETNSTTLPTTTVTEEPVYFNGYKFTLITEGRLKEVYIEDSALGDELRAIIGNLETEYGFTLEFTDASWKYEDVYPAVIANSKYADFIRGRQTSWVPLAIQGLIRPLDSDAMLNAGLDINNGDNFYQYYTHLSDFRGNTWAADMSGKFCMIEFGQTMTFNKRILDENGYPAATLFQAVRDKTWDYDMFLAAARACKEDTDNDGITDVWGISVDCDGDEIWSNGTGPLVYDAATDSWVSNLNDPSLIAALEFMQEFASDGNLYPSLLGESLSRGNRRKLFYNGQAAFASLYGPHYGSTGGTLDMADAVGLLPIPKGPDTDEYMMVICDVDAYFCLISNNDWATSAFIMNKIGEAVSDPDDYANAIKESLLGCEDSYEMLFEYCLPNSFMDITKITKPLNKLTRDEFYESVYNGTKTPMQAVETYDPLVKAELRNLFG